MIEYNGVYLLTAVHLAYLVCPFSWQKKTIIATRRRTVTHRRHVGTKKLPRWYPPASSLSTSSTKWRFGRFQSLIRHLDWCKWTTVCRKFSVPDIHNNHSNNFNSSTGAFTTIKQGVFYKTIWRYTWNVVFIPSCCCPSRPAKFVAEGGCNILSCSRFSLALLDFTRVHSLPFICCHSPYRDHDRPCHRGRAVFESATNSTNWARYH